MATKGSQATATWPGWRTTSPLPGHGAAGQPFLRLTDARYGALDQATGTNTLNSMFDGLDPRAITNIIGTQEAEVADRLRTPTSSSWRSASTSTTASTSSPRAATARSQIGGPGYGRPRLRQPRRPDPRHRRRLATPTACRSTSTRPRPLSTRTRPMDRTNWSASSCAKATAMAASARICCGADRTRPTRLHLLPTLRELILDHWTNNTVFTGPLPGGRRDRPCRPTTRVW